MIEELQMIVNRYKVDESIKVTGDMMLLSDLELNSFELVEMLCEVEERFGVEIPDRMINDFKTVQDLMDFVAAHA